MDKCIFCGDPATQTAYHEKTLAVTPVCAPCAYSKVGMDDPRYLIGVDWAKENTFDTTLPNGVTVRLPKSVISGL